MSVSENKNFQAPEYFEGCQISTCLRGGIYFDSCEMSPNKGPNNLLTGQHN
jgi:hypothetical protein